MEKTLFIASFPDLGSFDFSKTDIRVGDIDNSDYFFGNNSSYIHSYIKSLKKLVGTCDVLFVPATNSVISALDNEGIKCIVLYPNKDSKDRFLKDLSDSKMDEDFISMIGNSWDFIISKLEKHNYDYKFVMGEEDKVLDVLHALLTKKDSLGVSRDDIEILISDEIVDSLFGYCLLREDEISEGRPNIQSVFCEGIKYDYYFSMKRLNDKKEDITNLINSISSIEDGISVSKIGIEKNGHVWTESIDTMEKVMALGVSSGDLILPFSRELDVSLKGKVPYVIKREVLQNKGISC